jgi:hypothetical protein
MTPLLLFQGVRQSVNVGVPRKSVTIAERQEFKASRVFRVLS